MIERLVELFSSIKNAFREIGSNLADYNVLYTLIHALKPVEMAVQELSKD